MKNYTRRDWTLLLPTAAAAAVVTTSTPETANAAAPATLPSMVLPFDEMKVKTNADGGSSRQAFDGLTHSGYHLDMHLTSLAPGKMPHPAHHHEHEEIILLREGTIEVYIAGKTTKLGPGSVAYFASGEEHGLKNIGTKNAEYFVLATGRAVKES